LFTWRQFENTQDLLDEKSERELRYQVARDEINRLNSIVSKLNSSEIDVSKYVNEVTEDDIIDYIYSWVENTNN
jgi:hypothetical protein